MNKCAVFACAMFLMDSCSRPQQERAPVKEVKLMQPRPAPHVAAARQPTLDPRSSEAAEELVRAFAALLNSGHFADAYMLLGPVAPPRKTFEADLRRLHGLNVAVHSAAGQEGAAGSVYVSVPLTLSGSESGRQISRSGKAVLRRVNDVPGSTEAQRHWHIERIDWER